MQGAGSGCREVGVPDLLDTSITDIYHLTCSIPTAYHLPSDIYHLTGCRIDGAGCSSLLGTELGCRIDGADSWLYLAII